MRVGALVAFWLPLAFVVYRVARGWRSWRDFVLVTVAAAVAAGTDRYWDSTWIRSLSLAVSGGVAGAAILWALGPGSLPGRVVDREAVQRVQSRCPLCMLTLVMSLTSVAVWTVDRVPQAFGALLSIGSLAVAVLAVARWLRRGAER